MSRVFQYLPPPLSLLSRKLRNDSIISPFPPPPEGVKKFRNREIEGSDHARGRDKFRPPKQAVIFPKPALLCPIGFYAAEGYFFLRVILLGFVGGFVPRGVFVAGAEVASEGLGSGMAKAVIQIGQNTGMLLGPLVFGWTVESGGDRQAAFWALVPVSILGAVAGWRARIR